MTTISPKLISYIAGFLDGDGCILFQIVRRKDYRFGYQIRASIIFFQKTKNRPHLEWLRTIFECGYVRDRNDGMSEYTIVGLDIVAKILKLLRPYVRLKKGHVELGIKIHQLLRQDLSVEGIVQAASWVDGFRELNYSKKRINTSSQLKTYLQDHKLYPVTTDSGVLQNVQDER